MADDLLDLELRGPDVSSDLWQRLAVESERRARAIYATKRRCTICGEAIVAAPSWWRTHGVCDPNLLAKPPPDRDESQPKLKRARRT